MPCRCLSPDPLACRRIAHHRRDVSALEWVLHQQRPSVAMVLEALDQDEQTCPCECHREGINRAASPL